MTPTWIFELLDRRGVHYQHLHSPAGFDPESLTTDEHGCRQSAAEAVIAVADGPLQEPVVPADSWVDLDKVRDMVGHEVHIATEKELLEHYSDCEPGAIPPLRCHEGSDVLMDGWVDVNSNIVFLAGSRQDVIRMPIHGSS